MNRTWIWLTASLSTALLITAAASCSSGTGGTGGDTTSSSSSTSSSSGDPPPPCGHLREECCPGDACQADLGCTEGHCLGLLGYRCNTNDMCASGACTSIMRCSAPCASAADCPPGPEWDCGFLPGAPSTMCRCQISGDEVCDGRDNDCDAKVDVGVTDCKDGLVCSGGACVCPPEALCGGVCKDIATDPQNCGGCGAICAGPCSAGHCVEELGGDMNTGWGAGIALDDAFVYWTAGWTGTGMVLKIPKAGGAPVTLTSGLDIPGDIVSDGPDLYWVNGNPLPNGSVMTMKKSGGIPTILAAGQAYPGMLAVDATHVYWATDSVVHKVPKGGGAVVDLFSEQLYPRALAVDATHVYWGNGASIVKGPKSGGATTLVTWLPDYPSGMAIDATRVYWGMMDPAEIPLMAIGLSGGAKTALSAADVGVIGGGDTRIALDDANVYWMRATSPGYIAKVPKAGGPVTRLNDQVTSLGIAVDATHVYWVSGGGVVSRTKK